MFEDNFKSFYNESIPFKRTSNQHIYDVELTPAVYNKEAFEVYKKYELGIHKKEDKQKSSYEGFLCGNSLVSYDKEINVPNFPSKPG